MIVTSEHKTFLRIIGENIKKLRTQRGYSQEYIELSGEFAHSQLWKIEQGKINTSIIILNRIREVLGVEWGDIFKGVKFLDPQFTNGGIYGKDYRKY